MCPAGFLDFFGEIGHSHCHTGTGFHPAIRYGQPPLVAVAPEIERNLTIPDATHVELECHGRGIYGTGLDGELVPASGPEVVLAILHQVPPFGFACHLDGNQAIGVSRDQRMVFRRREGGAPNGQRHEHQGHHQSQCFHGLLSLGMIW